jgi:hypothetical protein
MNSKSKVDKNAEWEIITDFVDNTMSEDEMENNKQVSVGNLMSTIRRNMLIHVAKILLIDSKISIWGEFVRDIIRFHNSIEDKGTFHSINVHSEVISRRILDQNVSDFCTKLKLDSRFIKVEPVKLNDVRFSHKIYIVGEIPYNNLKYNFTINFTGGDGDICDNFDFDIDTLVMKQWDSHCIISKIPHITLGKVVSNILEKKFNTIMKLDSKFSLKTDADNLNNIRMIMRIVKFYDMEWLCEDKLGNELYDNIYKSYNSACPSCNQKSKRGIWSVKKDCCGESICLQCLEHIISDLFFEKADTRIFYDCACIEKTIKKKSSKSINNDTPDILISVESVESTELIDTIVPLEVSNETKVAHKKSNQSNIDQNIKIVNYEDDYEDAVCY